jgi:hypothetical protein
MQTRMIPTCELGTAGLLVQVGREEGRVAESYWLPSPKPSACAVVHQLTWHVEASTLLLTADRLGIESPFFSRPP